MEDPVRGYYIQELQRSFKNHGSDPQLRIYGDSDFNEYALKLERAIYLVDRVGPAYAAKLDGILQRVGESPELVILLLKQRVYPDDFARKELQALLQEIESSKIRCESCGKVEAVKCGAFYSSATDKYLFECWVCGNEFTGSPKCSS